MWALKFRDNVVYIVLMCWRYSGGCEFARIRSALGSAALGRFQAPLSVLYVVLGIQLSGRYAGALLFAAVQACDASVA